MFAGFPENRHEKIARTVNDRRAVGESIDGVDESADIDKTRNPVERAERSLDIRERVQRTDFRRFITMLDRLRLPHLAGMRDLPVDRADRARTIQEITGADGRHITAGGGRCIRQFQPKFNQLCLRIHAPTFSRRVLPCNFFIEEDFNSRIAIFTTALSITNDMAKSSAVLSLPEWQAFSAKDPSGAARELTRRMQTQLSEVQQRAVFAWMQTERELTATFERFAGTLAPLAGVPYALKDVFQVASLNIRAGSRFPAGVLPKKDRDGKLPHVLRGVGAVLAAKTNLYEFAYGLTGENPHYGDCEHPSFPDRTSGGSSSGSAAVVAAGIVPFATGTDTGGSIRVPAAFCGLYGMRTSVQHPWIEDAFPLAPSFDTAGWFTGNAQDMYTIHHFLLSAAKPERPLRGCFLDFAALGQTADPDVTEAVHAAGLAYAPAADATTAEQLRAGFSRAAETYAVLQSAEAYKVHESWLYLHRDHYSPVVWERLDRGRKWTTEQLDAAHAAHTAAKQLWANFFLTHDFLVLPATPFPALRKSDCTQANRERLLALTTPASLGGLPVLTIPVNLPSGLTTGLQIVVNSNQSPVIPWALKLV